MMSVLPRLSRLSAWLLPLSAALLPGCAQKPVPAEVTPPRYATLPPREVPAVLKGTILEIADLAEVQPRRVSGYGLVVNLEGTGDTTAPNAVREFMIKQMIKRGFGSQNLPGFEGVSPERVLRDPRVAIVRVDAFVPPGARKGQRMDAYVSVIPNNNTSSLARGTLYLCDLKPGGANPYGPDTSVNPEASARGSILVNPSYALETRDDPAARLSLRRGVVIGGAETKRERPLALRIRMPSPGTARYVERRIDLAFQDSSVASAQDEGIVFVRVPAKFGDDWQHFAGVVMHLFLNYSNEFAAIKARQLVEAAVLPDAPLENISYAWEALGEPALPYLQPLLTHPSPDVQYAATRAAAFIGSGPAARALLEMARNRDHPFQLNAVQTLSKLPQSPLIAEMLRTLLDTEDTLVRIAAYRALVQYRDPTVVSFPMAGRFWLDIVPSNATPVIHATRTGEPRLAIIGSRLSLVMPITFSAMDHRFTITSNDDDRTLTVFYRPSSGEPVSVRSRADLSEIVARLSGVAESREGLRLGYGTVVGILQALANQQLLVAQTASGTRHASFVLEDVSGMQDAIDSAPPIDESPRPQGDTPAPPTEPIETPALSGPGGTGPTPGGVEPSPMPRANR
jgi:hypothetical protein